MTTTATSAGSTPRAGSCEAERLVVLHADVIEERARADPCCRARRSRSSGCRPVSMRIGPTPGCSTRNAGIGSQSQPPRRTSCSPICGSASAPVGRSRKARGACISPVRIGWTRTVAPGRPPARGSSASRGSVIIAIGRRPYANDVDTPTPLLARPHLSDTESRHADAMTPTTPQRPDIPPERRRLAEAKRAARALRIRTIRRRIAAGAAALFVTAWVFITVQLVTGHDPALASSSATSRARR